MTGTKNNINRYRLYDNYLQFWLTEYCNDEAIAYCMESCDRIFTEYERKTILKSMEEYYNDDEDSYSMLSCDGTFSEDEVQTIYNYIEECYNQTKEALAYYVLSNDGTLSENKIEMILNSQKYTIHYNVINLESWINTYVVNSWNRLSEDEKEENTIRNTNIHSYKISIDDARWSYCVSLSEEMLKNLVYSKKYKIVIIFD